LMEWEMMTIPITIGTVATHFAFIKKKILFAVNFTGDHTRTYYEKHKRHHKKLHRYKNKIIYLDLLYMSLHSVSS